MERQTAPGLRYNKAGRPYWRASKPAVRKGYPVKSVNLSALKNRPAALVERCIRLERELEKWLSGSRSSTVPSRACSTFTRPRREHLPHPQGILQFEANQRQRDIVGEWVKLDEPTPPTDIVKGGLK